MRPHIRFKSLTIDKTTYTEVHGLGCDADGMIKGAGTYGRVLFGKDPDEKPVAIKVQRIFEDEQRKLEGCMLEIEMGKCMDIDQYTCPVFNAGKLISGTTYYMFSVMPRLEGRELYEFIQEKPKAWLNDRIPSIALNLITALQFLHGRGIVHRDIKAENVMYNGKTAILIDYNLSEIVDSNGEGSTLFLGTPLYIPPEVIERRPYTVKSDIYSLGVLLFEMRTDGQIPHLLSYMENQELYFMREKTDSHQHLFPGGTDRFPGGNYTETIDKLAYLCLNRDPEKRPSLEQLADVLCFRKSITGDFDSGYKIE